MDQKQLTALEFMIINSDATDWAKRIYLAMIMQSMDKGIPFRKTVEVVLKQEREYNEFMHLINRERKICINVLLDLAKALAYFHGGPRNRSWVIRLACSIDYDGINNLDLEKVEKIELKNPYIVGDKPNLLIGE